MNFVLHGSSVASGITIGHAHLVSSARLEVAHYEIAETAVPGEIFRFDAAIARAKQELALLEGQMPVEAPAEFAAFLNLHRMILEDSSLSHAPRELIRERRCNAEWALVQQMETLVEQFEAMEDAYLRERKADIQQVVERVLKALIGDKVPAAPQLSEEHKLIVVAHDLSPADMLLFKRHEFGGFVTDVGGVTSHTAILARSLNIPALVGLHHARHMIREGELLIVDGIQGVLVVDPDPIVLAEYQLRQSQHELERRKLRRLKSTPAATLDGVAVELYANIELPQDLDEVHEAGAQGVGLFRTEFLFMNRNDLPGEDEQFEAYREVARAMRGKPVVIRTLDIGADKSFDGHSETMPNPALGLRAIRYCLAEPQMFLEQLRAILRASRHGKVKILLPMVAHAHEVDQALGLIRQARQQLDDKGLPYDQGVEVGGMIEIPAAALSLGMFMKRLDFLSLGTNDLIQYTLAIDRTDDAVAHLYDPLHPAVLHLVAHVIHTATRGKVPVAVCGEMAGDLALTRLLLGLGLRSFSMHPAQLPAIKERVLRTSLAEAQPLAQKVLRSSDPGRTRELIARLNA
ncbi:MAG TPA: phosphoenolpyruvate--protein phosphotransferase [Burkholderiales bacterium]|nr:phosphoenolpyruvate--protein phosphotransferase [Burkholderiales bacterium]